MARSVQNVLQLDYNFKCSLLTNWSAKWGLKVDSGLVAILHLQRFAKDCQLTPDNYLCAFTVAHPVQIYLGPQIDARVPSPSVGGAGNNNNFLNPHALLL